ncbi:MAG TPA: hypothetical protein VLA61_05015 [Ideonella sp.]|uniref:hypothetical protein n=1 Tax=Ideonella sp. TaxID=1929293 RepID=UPI002CC44893|nr:hypothetical protein [Ideonella sp.]HSI47604.1 hypothetical protein [Ideonella sp.]
MRLRFSIRPLSLAALLLASTVSHAAETCEAQLQARLATDLALPFQAFDQTDGQGFRALSEAGCHKEAGDLIERYIAANGLVHPVLPWHLAQSRAQDGQYAEAIAAARQTLKPSEDFAANPMRWNDYALASIAFWQRDKAALIAHRDKVAEGAADFMPNQLNLRLLDNLIANFDLSYKDALAKLKKKA